MSPRPGARPVIAFGHEQLGERPDRAVAGGRARRVVRGVYTTDLTRPLEQLVRAHVWEIVAHFAPDAVIADRSAGPMLFDGNTLFVVSGTRARDLDLPGLRVAVRRGQGALADDPLWMGGIHKSSIPRALVENLAASRARAGIARTLSEPELGTWVAQLAQQHPPERLNRFRDRARELAGVLGLEDRFSRLDDIFGVVLGTRPGQGRGFLGATATGRGYDVARLARFTALAEALAAGTLNPSPAELPVLAPAMLAEQPFFEAYLSNFIEGTEFTVEEAAHIVYDRRVPEARPADAHDITATYELITDTGESGLVPAGWTELDEVLRRRHARLMALRPGKRPGLFKQEGNRVGSYEFVAPNLVEGTLERGLALRDQLPLPFARAVFMMFLICEVHPFDDGNGRLARLAMNAELTATGQHRILIPLIIGNDYISALRRLSREGDAGMLVRVLAGAWRWSAQVDFSTLDTARFWCERTHALVDAVDAERAGQYLLMPADLAG
jgi:hypothetical protein